MSEDKDLREHLNQLHETIADMKADLEFMDINMTSLNLQRVSFCELLLGLITNPKVNLSYKARIRLILNMMLIVNGDPTPYDETVIDALMTAKNTVQSDDVIKKSFNNFNPEVDDI